MPSKREPRKYGGFPPVIKIRRGDRVTNWYTGNHVSEKDFDRHPTEATAGKPRRTQHAK